jgi:hypothetical protein
MTGILFNVGFVYNMFYHTTNTTATVTAAAATTATATGCIYLVLKFKDSNKNMSILHPTSLDQFNITDIF